MNESRTDILISRLLDGEARVEDWQEFSSLASMDPELWRELAESQRQQNLLTTAVADLTKRVDDVELPDLSDDEVDAPYIHVGPLRPRVVAWVGWAAAAALAIVLWSGQRPNANTGGPLTPNSNTGTHVPVNSAGLGGYSPDELLQAYLDKGKVEGNVLGELPDKVLLETRPAAEGGGYEVLFIRTILERTNVPELYEFGAQDEAGRPVLARFEGRVRRPL